MIKNALWGAVITVVLLICPVMAGDLEAWLSKEIVNRIRISNPEIATENIRITMQNRDRLTKDRSGHPELRLRSDQLLEGYCEIPVYFVGKNGQVREKMTVMMQIDIYSEFLQTTMVIPAGTPISTANVKTVVLNATELPRNALHKWGEVEDKEVIGVLGKNVVLTASMFRKIPVIRRGQAISMHIEKDGVLLTVEGTALQDGYRDSLIAVKSVRFNKESKGKVLDNQNVQIIFN